MANQIRFLHLTDFHQGLPGGEQKTFWPTIKNLFFDDLPKLLEQMEGPLDLVLFTGDLTQSAQKSQFDAFSDTLHEIVEAIKVENLKQFREHFSDERLAEPLVLAVPGNHDIEWLDDPRDEELYLKYYDSDARWREKFWSDHPYRRTTVNNQLRNYQAWRSSWYKSHRAPEFSKKSESALIVGDFAATIQRDDLKLYVVGLNSAFLHLSREDHCRKLDIDPQQLHAVADEGWHRQHHAALLLTHHPSSWLSARSETNFKQHVYTPKRFFAHLCGHMHEPHRRIEPFSNKDSIQGASLFGLETLASGKQKRIYGYYGCKIWRSEDKLGYVKLWPRRAENDKNNIRIEADPSFGDLTEHSVSPRTVEFLIPLPLAATPSPTPQRAPARLPLPPPSPSGYIPHVDSNKTEQGILERLRTGSPKRAILIKGPVLAGKKWLWSHIRATFSRELSQKGQLCAFPDIDLSLLPQTHAEMLLALMQAVLSQSGLEGQRADDLYKELARGPNTALATRQLETALNSVSHLIVIQIYSVAVLWQSQETKHIYTMLRGWIQSANEGKAPYDRLRVVALQSTFDPPDNVRASALLPTFDPNFPVPSFELDQAAQLASLHGATLSPTLLINLHYWSQGHVGILCALIDYVKQQSIRRKSLNEEQVAAACPYYLGVLRTWLESRPKEREALRAISKAADFRLSAKQREYKEHIEGLRVLLGHDMVRLKGLDYVLASPVYSLALKATPGAR